MPVNGVERHALVSPDWLVSTRIDAGTQWRAAWEAVACHRSQLPNFDRLDGMSTEAKQHLWAINEYQRVFSTVNVTSGQEDDLFEGLRPAASLAEAA